MGTVLTKRLRRRGGKIRERKMRGFQQSFHKKKGIDWSDPQGKQFTIREMEYATREGSWGRANFASPNNSFVRSVNLGRTPRDRKNIKLSMLNKEKKKVPQNVGRQQQKADSFQKKRPQERPISEVTERKERKQKKSGGRKKK